MMTTLMHPDSELGKQWREKLAKKAHDVAKDVGEIAEKGSEAVADAIDTTRERHDPAPKLTEIANSKTANSLKHLSDEVSDVITGLGARETPDLRALLETHVAPRLVELRQRAAHLASDVADPSGDEGSPAVQAGKRFTESLAHADRALESWRGAAAGRVESAQSQVRTVGVQAKEGGKNAAASVIWLGAAAAVVYGGLLSDEQRRWVNAKSKAIAAGTADLFHDLRGRDGEFRG